MAAPHSVT